MQVLNLHHGRSRPVENLGFLIEIDGVMLLHVGDTAADTDDFRRNKLDEAKIDVAFLPYWYLAYESSVETVREGIQAAHFVAMHMPPKELSPSYLDDLGGFESAVRIIQKNFPGAIVFANEMETHLLTLPPGNSGDPSDEAP